MSLAWGLWFGGLIAAFAALEGFALVTGRPTLSSTVWASERRFPIIAFLTGCAIGALAIHFFGWIPACR